MVFLTGWVGLVLGFSGLIFIHELGHFLLAKWNGVRVHVFSIGMGPYIVSFTHNGTIYALSLIPLGGYVKMLGQDDLNADLAENKNPQDFRNKRPGQKAAILAAGAIFNIILTLFVFFGCYWSGLYEESPCIGNISPDKPLAKAVMVDASKKTPANLKPGDKVVRVNDIPVKSFFDVVMQVTACPPGEPVTLAVQRRIETPSNPPLPTTAPIRNERGINEYGPIEYVQVNIEQDKKHGLPNIGLSPGMPFREAEPLALGFSTELCVFVGADPASIPESAAGKTGKFKKGDRIKELLDATDPEHPVKIKLDSEYALTNAAAATEGKERIFVLANAEGVEREKVPVTPTYNKEEFGFKFGIAQSILKRVTAIDPNCDAYKAGLREGDLVRGFDTEESNVHPWRKGTLSWLKNLDEKTPHTAELTVPELAGADASHIFYQEYVAVEYFKAGGPTGGVVDAMSQSWDDTRRYTVCMFATIRNLVSGHVGAKNLSGPVGIGQSIFSVASRQEPKKYLWWLAFISLNLGVMQMLPIPLLDGFHLVLVLIEKIKGSAVSAKIQEKFFYAGMLLIGGLLVFVMWNDISRLITK